MTIPEPTEWEVTDTRVKAACRKLYAHATELLDQIVEGMPPGYYPPRNTDTVSALQEFIAACREEGLS